MIISALQDLKNGIELDGNVYAADIQRLCDIVGADKDTAIKLGAPTPDGDQALFYLLTCGLLKIAAIKNA